METTATKTRVPSANEYRIKNLNKELTGTISELRIMDLKETKFGDKYIHLVTINLIQNDGLLCEIDLLYWSSYEKLKLKIGQQIDFVITKKISAGKHTADEFHLDII